MNQTQCRVLIKVILAAVTTKPPDHNGCNRVEVCVCVCVCVCVISSLLTASLKTSLPLKLHERIPYNKFLYKYIYIYIYIYISSNAWIYMPVSSASQLFKVREWLDSSLCPQGPAQSLAHTCCLINIQRISE